MKAPRRADAPRFSDEQLGELIELIGAADSVELKLTVPDEDRLSTVSALGMDALDAVIRQVFFFDTPELALEAAGLVLRARRTQGKRDDSLVKLRPVVPYELPDETRRSKRFGVEVDVMPGGFACSGSFKGEPKAGRVKDVVAGRQSLRKLFSADQRSFYADHAPDGVEFDDLAILGPVHVLKLKYSPKGFDRKLVAESWFYPDGSRILELSTKCGPAEAFDLAARARVYLSERGVKLSGEQRTKTRTALEFFAGKLQSEAAG